MIQEEPGVEAVIPDTYSDCHECHQNLCEHDAGQEPAESVEIRTTQRGRRDQADRPIRPKTQQPEEEESPGVCNELAALYLLRGVVAGGLRDSAFPPPPPPGGAPPPPPPRRPPLPAEVSSRSTREKRGVWIANTQRHDWVVRV